MDEPLLGAWRPQAIVRGLASQTPQAPPTQTPVQKEATGTALHVRSWSRPVRLGGLTLPGPGSLRDPRGLRTRIGKAWNGQLLL